jgi:hypothetical protein
VGARARQVGFLKQLSQFEVAQQLAIIDGRVPAPPPETSARQRAAVRTSIDVGELAVDMLMAQHRDGFLCRGMPPAVFTRDLCRAALEERPITGAGMVDAMMFLEQQNRTRSNTDRATPDLTAYKQLEAKREARERAADPTDAAAAAQRDVQLADAADTEGAIGQLASLKAAELGDDRLDAMVEEDVSSMAAVAPEGAQLSSSALLSRKQQQQELEAEAEAQRLGRGAAGSASRQADATGEVAPPQVAAAEEDLAAMRRKVDREAEHAAMTIQSAMKKA